MKDVDHESDSVQDGMIDTTFDVTSKPTRVVEEEEGRFYARQLAGKDALDEEL